MHCSTYYVCLMILLLWVHVMYCISSPDKDWPNCVVISHVGIAFVLNPHLQTVQ
jgi:hypothetical protein